MIQRQGLRTQALLILVLGITALISACGDSKEKNENLQQAFKFHEEAIKFRQTAEDQISKLKADTDSLFVATYSNDLKSISSALEAWDEQLIEVPGFEEEHDHSHHDHSGHDHDHHHHNHSQQELTPEQHLEVQQHLLQEIKGLVEKINSIKQ
nr:hypothetical protein [uncultured Allomuricauda sp.]